MCRVLVKSRSWSGAGDLPRAKHFPEKFGQHFGEENVVNVTYLRHLGSVVSVYRSEGFAVTLPQISKTHRSLARF